MPAQAIRVSNSKLKTYRRCPRRYEYKYIKKLDTRKRSVALERGSWIHALLEVHYDGEDWEDEHKVWTNRFFEYDEEVRDDLGPDLPQEVRRIMRSYLRHYRREDQNFVVVDSELNEIITLPNGVELNVIIDLIVEEIRTGLLWAWDHKTRKTFESSDNMLLDPQLTLYFGALELMGYTPMAGVTYNEIRTKAPTIPQLLKAGGLSKAKNIDTTVGTYMAAIRKYDLNPADYTEILQHLATNEPDRFFRRVNLPKDPPIVENAFRDAMETAEDIIAAENNGRYPRAFDARTCKWDCDFKDLCLTELHGASAEPLIKLNFRRRGQID